jgi:ADP-heptose:LPS heptosyltransferase
MRYFVNKGYEVVLDTTPEIFELFVGHPLQIRHLSKVDIGRIKFEKTFNLDMSYESKPKQNRLKSYFEFCGVKDYELSRPILFPFVDAKTKLFKKYAILHIDEKEIKHRNVYGVYWKLVRNYLEEHGYTVFQIGVEKHEIIGIELNAPSLSYLKYFIAGCDLFIGIDSGPLNIAMAYNKPCVGFFGSVNPEYVYPNLKGLEVIQQKCIYQHCYHEKPATTTGIECVIDKDKPPCCVATFEQVIRAISNLINKNDENNI